ncbi:hypothetical protein [Oceanobacillus polygoni]|uniref:Uncharacterized protein n=1 Tax=Oceanobacillus polygoni TaxID=1235259 RepID=A0A9X1CE63_9BACI|nr:hypothetical protein [Oceanobacillus polygoni]MBP2079736.1 hypothetical protein [Oceanobacillus polygoni]
MNAWLSLTKKEFQLGLPAFLIVLILYAGILSGGYFIGNSVGYTEGLLSVALGFVVTLHIFFLPFYLYYSLSAERKRLHLWLHTPMSIAGLLSSKIVTGIIFMITTFAVFVIGSTNFFLHSLDFFNQETIFNLIGSITVFVFTLGLFIAATFLFFWSIFLTFSQLMNDFISFILTFILFLFLSWIYGTVMELSFMQTLTNWGSIQLNDIIVGFEFDYFENAFEAQTMSESSIFYIGNFVRDIVVAAIMFIAACWIIEKKVEV